MFLMNLDAWNSLEPDLQQAVIDGMVLANHRGGE